MSRQAETREGDATALPLLEGLSICLVEDDGVAAKVYSKWLEAAGASVRAFHSFHDVFEALEGQRPTATQMRERQPDLLLTDFVLPDGTGLDVIQAWKKHFPQAPALVITAFATVENAVNAMKLGAFDFLEKPLQREELILVLQRAREHLQLLRENANLSQAVRILSMAQTIAGVSEKGQLLKTLGRLLLRELLAQECFVYSYNGGRRSLECVLDLRPGGVQRSAPEDIQAGVLGTILQRRPPAPENYADIDPTQHLPVSVTLVKDGFEGLLVTLDSPTGNAAFIVLLAPHAERLLKPRADELNPLIVQAGRVFHNTDLASALSFVDELTGLYNQKFLEVALSKEVARANRYGTPLSLLFFDLDKFKSINDTHGHLVGSQIIKESARLARDMMRDSDQLLRYGGDEFVAVLPNTGLAGAEVLAERLRRSFEQTVFDARAATGVASAKDLNVTASLGIASYPACAGDVKELIQRADEAMYEAKRGGKNRVALARPLPEPEPP